ncbi:hypothetical protein F0562_019674 [Nyssa sinensis]|uniref:Uncharacterized protein n=1 Tax=Nyssa sinensis TaxID=561372 RepID=A0A5J5BUH7_9ASTE|nr:hypothetical protein F0562_019674 [Nyssa sinensis]
MQSLSDDHLSQSETVFVQPKRILKNDELTFITVAEDSLETKRVDPTSYSAKISNDSEDSKGEATSCETTICDGDEQDSSNSQPKRESMDTQNTTRRISKSQHEETQELTPEFIQQLQEVVTENEITKDAEALHNQQVSDCDCW